MTDFEKRKEAVHAALVNLDDVQKSILIANCTLQGVEVEAVENTIASILSKIDCASNGLLLKNSKFLSK